MAPTFIVPLLGVWIDQPSPTTDSVSYDYNNLPEMEANIVASHEVGTHNNTVTASADVDKGALDIRGTVDASGHGGGLTVGGNVHGQSLSAFGDGNGWSVSDTFSWGGAQTTVSYASGPALSLDTQYSSGSSGWSLGFCASYASGASSIEFSASYGGGGAYSLCHI